MRARREEKKLQEKTHRFILGVAGALTYLPRTFINQKLIRKLFRLLTGMGKGLLGADIAKTKSQRRREIGMAERYAADTNFRLSIIADMGLMPKKIVSALIRESKEIADILTRLIRRER